MIPLSDFDSKIVSIFVSMKCVFPSLIYVDAAPHHTQDGLGSIVYNYKTLLYLNLLTDTSQFLHLCIIDSLLKVMV